MVVLSQYADGSYADALLAHGTDGLAYLLKERVGDLTELMRALGEVCAGRTALDTRMVDALIARRRTVAPDLLDTLTSRERDVLHEMARGLSNAGIAQALALSESAVEKHIGAIFAKLGTTNNRTPTAGSRPSSPTWAPTRGEVSNPRAVRPPRAPAPGTCS